MYVCIRVHTSHVCTRIRKLQNTRKHVRVCPRGRRFCRIDTQLSDFRTTRTSASGPIPVAETGPDLRKFFAGGSARSRTRERGEEATGSIKVARATIVYKVETSKTTGYNKTKITIEQCRNSGNKNRVNTRQFVVIYFLYRAQIAILVLPSRS